MKNNTRALKNLKKNLDNFVRSGGLGLFSDIFECGPGEIRERINQALKTEEEKHEAHARKMRKREFRLRVHEIVELLQDRRHNALALEVERLYRVDPKLQGYQGRVSQAIRRLVAVGCTAQTIKDVADLLAGNANYHDILQRSKKMLPLDVFNDIAKGNKW